MEYEVFSQRQQRLKGEIPDVYQYETIPQELRVQVIHIWNDVFRTISFQSSSKIEFSHAHDAYKTIHNELCREYGRFSLDDGSNFYSTESDDAYYNSEAKLDIDLVIDYFLQIDKTEMTIDVIEVSFRYIDQEVRNNHDNNFDPRISPDEAIDQLNRRFHQHRVGYQYESGQIMKVDSQFIHSEVVKPALVFLSDPLYKGANQEFLNAHEHYRNDRYKECLNDCLKAFESCLKIICLKNGWSYSEKDTANRLIDIVSDYDLIDSYMKSHFTSLISTLRTGVPTVRNRLSGHGQGPDEITVPEYIAAYILHLTASNILLLAKADKDMK